MKILCVILLMVFFLFGDTVTIHVGDNWQSITNANPPGTIFLIEAGTHNQVSDTPKSKQEFIGTDGVICHGNDITTVAFYRAGLADSVIIKNIRFTHYATTFQRGTIELGARNNQAGGRGWQLLHCTLDSNVVPDSGGWAIEIGKEAIVIGNTVLYYGEAGFQNGDTGSIFDSNYIAYCNWRYVYPRLWESCGGKISRANNMSCSYNTVVHNVGIGIWVDIDCDNINIHNNRVDSNNIGGILYEISKKGIIHNNICTRNAFTDTIIGYVGAQISVSEGDSTIVYNNICTVSSKKGDGILFTYSTQVPDYPQRGSSFYNNTIYFDSSRGVCGHKYDDTNYLTWGNIDSSNFIYIIKGGAHDPYVFGLWSQLDTVSAIEYYNKYSMGAKGCVKLQH